MNFSQLTNYLTIETMMSWGMQVFTALIILFIGFRLATFVSNLMSKALLARNIDNTLVGFLASMARYAIIALTIVMMLGQFGVETTSLVAMLGAATLAIGLALQGTLSHLAAGVMIVFFRPFKVGDYIEGAGIDGIVKNVNLFTTELGTLDNVQIIVPNGQLWGAAIKNYTFNRERRIDMNIGIGYGANIDEAIKTLQGVIKKDTRAFSKKGFEPMILVTELADSAVILQARVWTHRDDRLDLEVDLRKGFKEALDKAGIEIPFPQRVVYHKNMQE